MGNDLGIPAPNNENVGETVANGLNALFEHMIRANGNSANGNIADNGANGNNADNLDPFFAMIGPLVQALRPGLGPEFDDLLGDANNIQKYSAIPKGTFDILYTDDCAAIDQYLSTPEGKEHINMHRFPEGTPLFYACVENRSDVRDVLIKHGCDPNAPSFVSELRPLSDSAARGDIDTIRVLLDAGADPNIPNRYGSMAINVFINRGYLDIIKLLTPYTNFTPSKNSNLFDSAIKCKFNDIFEYIFDYCNDINYTDCEGNTYLHKSVINDNKHAVEFLLRKGVDINIINNDEKLARDLTTDSEILALFDHYYNK